MTQLDASPNTVHAVGDTDFLSHDVNGSIRNNTDQTLTLAHSWFQFGDVQGNFPASIAPGSEASFQCSGLVSCSGWVTYTYNDELTLYFAFSNPAAGQNGIDIGSDTSIWNSMTGHYLGLERTFLVTQGALYLCAHLLSTSGDTNYASWIVDEVNVQPVVPANPTLDNVESAYDAIPTTGTRTYYECAIQPTDISGVPLSHFKGMAFYAGKVVFTHTNLSLGSDPYGKYVIADVPSALPVPGQGMTDATYDTRLPGLRHPCSAQACGSFMAMGIQEDASSTKSSIEILDIRDVPLNSWPNLIGVIPIPTDGVNGVGMTKQIGNDGRYVVAAVNGSVLTIYLSKNSSFNLNDYGQNVFDLVATIPGFPDSGAGLALLTQTDGAIFMVALNADDSGQNNVCNLYSVSSDLTSVTPVAQKAMTVPGISDSVSALAEFAHLFPPPFNLILEALLKEFGEPQLNTSFRWGKGLSIQNGSLSVYATDRNSIPWSWLPVVPINKDFSVVEWGGSSNRRWRDAGRQQRQ